MPDPLGFQPIVNGANNTVNELVAQVTVQGSTAYLPTVELVINSALVDVTNPLPIYDQVAEAAMGTPGDTAWSGSGNGSVIALLKAMASAGEGETATAALQTAGNTSLTTIASGQGAGGSGIVQPSGGSGVQGWLSGIYNAVVSALTVKTPDTRSTGNLVASGTLNAALTVQLNNGQGVVAYTISGLTASGATLTSEYSNDGTTWSSHNVIGNPFTSTITTDGQYRVNGGGHVAVRLRVSVIGTGNVTISYNASSQSSLIDMGATVPTLVPTLSYTSPDTFSVQTTSSTLAAAAAYKTSLTIATLPASTTNVWLNVRGAAAVVGAGYFVPGGGGSVTFGGHGLPLPTAAITAITDSGSAQTVALAGG